MPIPTAAGSCRAITFPGAVPTLALVDVLCFVQVCQGRVCTAASEILGEGKMLHSNPSDLEALHRFLAVVLVLREKSGHGTPLWKCQGGSQSPRGPVVLPRSFTVTAVLHQSLELLKNRVCSWWTWQHITFCYIQEKRGFFYSSTLVEGSLAKSQNAARQN